MTDTLKHLENREKGEEIAWLRQQIGDCFKGLKKLLFPQKFAEEMLLDEVKCILESLCGNL